MSAPHPADEEPLPPFERELRRSAAPERFRMLPASDIAEIGVLCSIIIAPDAVLDFCEERGIDTPLFHHPSHATIFRVLRDMRSEHKPIDVKTLSVELHARGVIESVGGFAAVSEIACYLPTATAIDYYAGILRDKHTLRQVATIGTRFHERAHEDQDDVDGVLEDFEKSVMAIRPIGRNVRCYSGRDIARMAMESIKQQLDRPDELTGLSTGFHDLDMKTDGMHETELIVLAARPRVGKSALAGQIGEYLSLDNRIPTGFFSLEMGRVRYSRRCLLSRARVDPSPWRGGRKPTQSESDRIQRAADEYASAPYFVEELSDATVQHLRTAARRMVQQHGVRFIAIDSLSKLRSNSKQGRDSREREVSEAIGGCKEIAKELGIPVMVIVHINRDIDKTPFARPTLNLLRESGSIEAEADSVWMLYRREDGTTGLYMPKQRDGAEDEECGLCFQGCFTRFKPAETAEQEADAMARRQRELPL